MYFDMLHTVLPKCNVAFACMSKLCAIKNKKPLKSRHSTHFDCESPGWYHISDQICKNPTYTPCNGAFWNFWLSNIHNLPSQIYNLAKFQSRKPTTFRVKPLQSSNNRNIDLSSNIPSYSRYSLNLSLPQSLNLIFILYW